MHPQQESAGDRATRVYRQPPLRLNCAQAVAHALASDETATAVAATEHAGHGGGKAPGNECGALYAACQVAARNGNDVERIRARFAAQYGATTCHDLRAKRIPCVDCVRTAADLLDDTRPTAPAEKR